METPALLVLLARLLSLIDDRLAPDDSDAIRALGDQALRLTGLLVRRAERAALQAAPPVEINAPLVDAIIAARRLRARHLGADVGDPSWALILAAYAARLDGRSYSPAELRAAAGVPQTTALRWTQRLRADGLMTRHDDPEDGRGALFVLSDTGAARVEAYLKAALRISPVLV